jgi:hypothetical protein
MALTAPLGAPVKTVYVATNTADAHVVSSLLQQSGIDAVVLDENIGPYGHSLGSVRVVVAPESETASREIIADLESAPRAAPPPAKPAGLSLDAVVILIGVVALLVVVWYFGSR